MDPIVYRIDEADRVVFVNEAWDVFAHANGGDTVRSARLYGRNLYDSVADDTVRQIYRTVVEHARAGRPVRFRYRCDAPARRREFDLEVRARSPYEVEFASTLITETERPPVALLSAVPRALEALVRICSWCHAVAQPAGRWQPLEEGVQHVWASVPARLTHGICPTCAEAMFARLRGN